MTSVEKRNDIIGSLKISDPSILQKIDKELDILEVTDGINSINNLDNFYNLWKKNIDKKGHKNDINSWTAYGLGMTEARPQGEFLPLRRAFARAGFPDIDSDFDYFRRQEVYDYIIDKYGRENVGNIGTYSSLKLKSAIRRIGKALDVANAFHKGDKDNKTLNEAKVKEIIDTLPDARGAILKMTDEDGNDHAIKTIQDAYDHCPDFRKHIDKIPNFLNYAKDIEGTISNYGIHAAGIVISNSPLCDLAPLRTSKAGFATQYPYEDLEDMGLIKFDILAISTLTVIQKTAEMIKNNYGISVDIKNLKLTDEKTYDLYKTGKLVGVFQCEGHGMQETMQEIEPTSFNDIMAAISLYRPGPMASIPEYCARKKGHKNVEYFHPSIEKHVKPYLKDTYGLLVYQEQIMQICNALAGFSVTDGYIVIKGIGKKKVELIEKYKKQFIKGANENDLPENLSEQYWERFITPFAAYGFNRAHCISGKMRVKDKITGNLYTIDELIELDKNKRSNLVIDSYIDGTIIDDTIIDVFETGEKDIYQINLNNGMTLECTLEHKFYCSDGKEYTVSEILRDDLEIIYSENMQDLKKCKVVSVKKVRKEKTYNLTMASSQHNYAIYDKKDDNKYVISKNSCSYAYTSYVTAYLKANYTDEFMCCYLNVENYRKQQNSHKKVKILEKDLKKFNIDLLGRDINKCNVDYEIVKKGSGSSKTQILPSLMCKGVSAETAQEIVDNRPFKNLRELAYKTGNTFTRDSLKCLVEDRFFEDEFKSVNRGRNRENKIELEAFGLTMADKFDKLRKDKKRSGKKGIGDESLFD